MTAKDIIETLKQKASQNQATNDVLHAWAARERARQSVTVEALTHRMKREGFKHTREDYAEVLKTMADLGIGQLVKDSKGRISALKDVKTTLQSLGSAVVGTAANLKSFRARNRYRKMPHNQAPAPAASKSVVITVYLGQKALPIPVPKDLTSEEIADLVEALQAKFGG